MTNVTPLHPTPVPSVSFRYSTGDITRALAEGLKHEQIAADIETVLYGLLFTADDHAVDMARLMLSDLLEAQRTIRL